MSPHLVSGDWGTSNLRLRLVDAGSGAVLAEVRSDEGVGRVHARWHAAGGDRAEAYRAALARELERLEEAAGASLADAPVMLSGMAGSSLGIEELPYARVPFSLADDPPVARVLPRALPRGQRVVLLSGLRTEDDVMRGEETQLVGLLPWLEVEGEPAVVVLPGTHSKHVRLEGGRVTGFRTHMTGELFALLAEHSVLRASVRRPERGEEALPGVAAGVAAARELPLTHALFRVRAGTVLGDASREWSHGFLSGLLIGVEVAELAARPGPRIHLCAGPDLEPVYAAALEAAGLGERLRRVPPDVVERSAALGHLVLFRTGRVPY